MESLLHVAKFGGTSVGTPERVRRAVELVVDGPEGRRVVVASAFGGVTDLLLDAIVADVASLDDTKIPDTISLANINAEVDTAVEVAAGHRWSCSLMPPNASESTPKARYHS